MSIATYVYIDYDCLYTASIIPICKFYIIYVYECVCVFFLILFQLLLRLPSQISPLQEQVMILQ